ncbi:hypothetical protein [Geoglobus acetivorans]|uniref:Uncharacterized protein n=1 Tax=Geoglobus acetivorans TaxID=565033 RepID=A0ABZ3H4Z5_GEOAI|nr:hypothetical protein [Geoglobus acetivorans]
MATASVGYVNDLRRKFRRAGRLEGFRFIHVHAPCPPGWRFDASMTVDVARMAVETLAWILWEYDGRLRISELSKRAAINRRDLEEYFRIQGRFKTFSDSSLKRIALEIEEKYRILEHLESEHQ